VPPTSAPSRSAIQNEELSLYYQPQVNIETGEIIGIESLVRWHNPVLGKVTPAELIPIAEKNGQIIAIGEWVLLNACQQMKSWQSDGYQIPKIAVNISPVQFNDEKLVDTVKRILNETGLAPHYLELEITESVALYNEDSAFHKLQLLKDIGIKVALDDFGSGYSSLVYLFQFPFDTLKIDRSFMKNIMDNVNNRILVETIITMAHGFNFNVIAEGVDTMEQFHFLKEKQCDEVQGFLISEPVHGDGLLRLVEKYQTSALRLKAIS
jgi:EAL domain-containing protein (putative c-di-GMP-specific phosphodiesterase class I)